MAQNLWQCCPAPSGMHFSSPPWDGTPVLAWTPWVPGSDPPPGAPKLVHASQAGTISCWILHGLHRQVTRLWQWVATCTLGKCPVMVCHCSQLSFSVCFLSLMSILMFPDTFSFLILVCTQGKVSLTHAPVSP